MSAQLAHRHFKSRHADLTVPDYFKRMSAKEYGERLINVKDKSKKSQKLKNPALFAKATPARIDKVVAQLDKLKHNITKKTATTKIKPRTATATVSIPPKEDVTLSAGGLAASITSPTEGIPAFTTSSALEGIAALTTTSASEGIAALTSSSALEGLAALTSSSASEGIAALITTSSSTALGGIAASTVTTCVSTLPTISSVPSLEGPVISISSPPTDTVTEDPILDQAVAIDNVSVDPTVDVPLLSERINSALFSEEAYTLPNELLDDPKLLDYTVNVSKSPFRAINTVNLDSPARDPSTSSNFIIFSPTTSEAWVEVRPIDSNNNMFTVLDKPAACSTPKPTLNMGEGDHTLKNIVQSPSIVKVEDRASDPGTPEKLEPTSVRPRPGQLVDRASSPIKFADDDSQPSSSHPEPTASSQNEATDSTTVTSTFYSAEGHKVILTSPRNYTIHSTDGQSCFIQ